MKNGRGGYRENQSAASDIEVLLTENGRAGARREL